LSITLVVMVVEIIGGIFTGSIALLSDAGHMFTHSLAIAISLVSMIIARKEPTGHQTFGLYRVEILAALINGLFLLGIAGFFIYEAIVRIVSPRQITALQMIIIAVIGLAVNLASIFILKSGFKKNLSVKSVFYHLIGDAVSSVGIVIAGIVIFYTNWSLLDPIISIGISGLIIYWAISIIRDSSRILLEIAPRGLNADMIKRDLKKKFPEIKRLEGIRVWSISSDIIVLTANVKISSNSDEILDKVKKYLWEKYGIIESTIELI
ncbi:MAG: cation diffusion facilitator family transporter, partial [Actinomycetota bacterium]